MSEPVTSLSPPIDLDSFRSRIAELRNVDANSVLGAREADKLINDVGFELERKINWISPDWISNLSSLSSEDLNEILEQLKQELGEVEGENVAIEHEIEEVERRCTEDYDHLDSELEKLCCLLESIESQEGMQHKGKNKDLIICLLLFPKIFKSNSEAAKENVQMDVSYLSEEHGSKFKNLELSQQIEKSKKALKSLQDLDSTFKIFEAVEKMEEAFTGLRVIEIDGNNIRLSLKTYIPYLETVLLKQDIENIIEPLEMNHELIIETVDTTWELKNAEIFPNDIYIGDIVDAAKYSRQLYSPFTVTETRSSLECLVRRVQARVALSSLRRFVAKNVNTSKHSFEYLGREETIVAHVAGGIDAFIKLPQGWPLSDVGLELISLKSTNQSSKEISLSLHCKVMETVNSLKASARHNMSAFADSIEDILMQKMREELNPDISAN